MASRDRTALFLRYREEASALHGSPAKLRSRNAAAGGVAEGAKPHAGSVVRRARTGSQEPEWMFIHKDLMGDIAEIETTLNRLSSLYAKHLLPSFGDGDHAALESDIRVLATELTQMVHGAEGKIRRIGAKTDAGDDALVRRNVQKRFATQLQDFSMTFRRKQKDYLSELQGQRDAIGSSSVAIDLHCEMEPTDAQESARLRESSAANSQVRSEHEDSRLAAEERSREISKIAANINDLASIVKDLATLVVDQGTVLDRVDYNVEEVRTTTKDAVRELRIADRYQKKRHAFWCIVILSVACGILFCLLLLKWFS